MDKQSMKSRFAPDSHLYVTLHDFRVGGNFSIDIESGLCYHL